MAQNAFQVSHLANDLRFVVDGQELMDYLLRRDKFADRSGKAGRTPRSTR